jgi:hypothetical protein
LKAHPAMTGAVCDLGYLHAGAEAYLRGTGVADRSRFIAGDFFQSVPAGFDLCLMKFIVHDWGDEDARRILANARTAAGTLALIEQVVPDRLTAGAGDQAIIRADLTMMGMGGKERTAQEYRDLLAGSGWQLSAIIPTRASFSVIEAEPA